MKHLLSQPPSVAILGVAGVLLLLVLASGLGVAYIGGVFTGRDAVAENDKRILREAALHSPAATVPDHR